MGAGVQIIVTHLTRMEYGHICVAGIEPRTGRHIRPQTDDRLSVRRLLRHGGPFDLGCLVDLGTTTAIGSAPYLEDQSFNARNARCLKTLEPSEYWSLLERVTRPNLIAIFGEALQRRNRTYTVDMGCGNASLGCLRSPDIRFEQDRANAKLRLAFSDAAGPVSLALTDLRFYQSDHRTPRWEAVERVDKRLRSGVPALICVGLTKPWKMLGDTASRHWLQANNIHLGDEPVWQECSL